MSSSFLPLRIVATGMALPVRHVTSSELDAEQDYTAGTSLRHSGVHARHLAGPAETQSSLGAAALEDALLRACLGVADVDLLLAACGVAEQALPGTACAIAHAAGMPAGVPAFDINASCLSFTVALHTAAALLASGCYRRIAIVSADLPSRGVDWSRPGSSTIFGDGAAAAIVEAGERGQGILAWQMATYTEGRHLCEIKAGGTLHNPRTGVEPEDYLFSMDGRGVYRLAAKVVPPLLATVLARSGCSRSTIDLVVPHQASHHAMAHMGQLLELDPARIINIYASHGNQVAASIPCALHHAAIAGRLRPGGRVLLLGTAAGMSAAAMVLAT